MIENIRLSFRGIFSHKLRSLLTMLGIIIGIAAIIAIVSTIQGTNEQIQKNLIGAGVNNVNVLVTQGDWEYDFSGGIPSGVGLIKKEQLKELQNIKNSNNVSLYHKRQDYNAVYHLNTALNGGYVYGVDTAYFNTTGLVVKRGRGFTQHDLDNFRLVCVLDDTTVDTLFDGKDPVGLTVEIKNVPYEVIGVVTDAEIFEPQISSVEDYYTFYQEKAGKVFVPETTWPVIYQYDEPFNVVLQAAGTADMTAVGKEAESILAPVITSENYTYKAQDLMQQAREIQQLSQSTNTMLIWIAGISLLVGGIGVMNIMLVSVTERTSEIGLKKAIGAPKRAIMTQFLTEAVALTSMGGVLGVITGIILAELISQLNGTPVAISWPASIAAVLFSMAIGIIFGMLPSRKAANLDPIEALRHE
ncbi:MAG: ABC transporter permease [Firmicutes bacterium]|nr:ABC transporter permease [Bacillota bacterium]MBQ6661935.1 ABC transporter permease [Bacillota bacterium]